MTTCSLLPCVFMFAVIVQPTSSLSWIYVIAWMHLQWCGSGQELLTQPTHQKSLIKKIQSLVLTCAIDLALLEVYPYFCRQSVISWSDIRPVASRSYSSKACLIWASSILNSTDPNPSEILIFGPQKLFSVSSASTALSWDFFAGMQVACAINKRVRRVA